MSRRVRLDAELVRRGLARSREQAANLIADGKVLVAGQVASKAATQITTDQPVLVKDNDDPNWASRGAYKLLGALEVFEPMGLSVQGRRALDAGASTGGFTDVLLRRGVREVVAVDVGYGQLVWSLQSDQRVHVFDRTNIRSIDTDLIGGPVNLVVSDLSFISLTLVIDALAAVSEPGADMVLMVKPQFEVGKENLGKNGVVRDRHLHAWAIEKVTSAAWAAGWGTRGLAPSPLPGPAGNVEYFCWLRTDAPEPTSERAEAAVASGPLMSSQAGPEVPNPGGKP